MKSIDGVDWVNDDVGDQQHLKCHKLECYFNNYDDDCDFDQDLVQIGW